MNIELRTVTIRELCHQYLNENESGVTAYSGKLNVRPPYQREFVYKDAQRDEVIRSVMAGMPLNVFYWAVAPDDKFEMLDGQQRTMSICEFVDKTFSVDGRYFHSLTTDEQERFLDYEMQVYVCDGTDSEKLKWFQIINIAGEKLTEQELRNAIYAGPWVSDARRYFSKSTGGAYQLGNNYMKGTPIRQDYLETVLSWVARDAGMTIDQYMSAHQFDENASALWQYFRRVIKWVKDTFKTTYSDMKGIDWGKLYADHKDDTVFHKKDGSTADIDADAIDAEIRLLRGDADVTSKKGVFEFVLTGDARVLSIRQFEPRDQKTIYERQGHKCPLCVKAAELAGGSADDVEELPFEKMHADHITPWSAGGPSTIDNLQMLCVTHNLAKSNKQ